MPVVFGAPQFFLLVPLLILIGWYFRRLQLQQPLRVVVLLILVTLLADPMVLQKQRGMDLWVIVDRSESTREVVDRDFDEWKSLLEQSRGGKHNRLYFVDYADEVVTRPGRETAIYPGNRSLTRTGLAVQEVLTKVDPKRHSRLLLFSDGYSTEPLTGVAEKLVTQEIPLDYRRLLGSEDVDYRVASVDLPGRVQLGEPFLMDLTVAGTADDDIPVEIYRDGRKLTELTVEVREGRGRTRLSDRIVTPGSHRYEVLIEPDTDAHAANNRFENWIEVVAGPRILLVTNYDDDPLETALRAQGFEVIVVRDSLTLDAGMLTGARSVIFNNVPAYEVPGKFLDAIDFFVREQGGGFLMAGGKYSFGSGGYFDSSVDPLLPVSMELKSEHRKLAVAMAIVMDRSGSMGMTVASGDTKMDLANEGAARAVELLGGSDAVTVYAVDSQAHEIAPLLNVGKFRGDLVSRIRSIESMGGGIFVYTGLKEAWESLKGSELGQRHIILFSDAADSEEPGQYERLIAEMRKGDATVSVIGLGTRADPDAAFLEDIATRGEGRIFFSEVPGDLPNIFAQETVTVARSTFIDDPVGTQSTGGWFELSNQEMNWLASVDGYNLSYIREGDQASLVSTDEYRAPLVSFGRRGIGRTAAVSYPMGGEFSGAFRAWEEAGDFMQTLNRWLMGEEVPPGIGLKHRIVGTQLSLDLFFEPDPWQVIFATKPPRIVLSRGESDPVTSEPTWERLAPGHYSLSMDLGERELIRGAAQVGGAAIPFGPLVVGSSREWAFDLERIEEMRQVSMLSGGRELVDLADAWTRPSSRGMASIQSWLLVPLLVLILMEALMTRTGWKMPLPGRMKIERNRAKKPKEKPRQAAKKEPAEEPKARLEEEADQTAPDRQSRFDRAKKRR